MKLNLHIERLVLDGIAVAPAQQRLLQASVKAELERKLAEGGLASGLAEGNALSRITTDSIQLPGNNTERLGQQIAQSVYGGIGRE